MSLTAVLISVPIFVVIGVPHMMLNRGKATLKTLRAAYGACYEMGMDVAKQLNKGAKNESAK